MKKKLFSLLAVASVALASAAQHSWTLSECINYALTNNISIRKALANVETQQVTLKESHAAMLPSLTGNVQQNASIAPLVSSRPLTYSASYGVSAQWTVWDSQRRRLNISNAQLALEQSQLSVEESANSIVEELVQRYVQILYMEEAAKVNEELLKQDSTIYRRGQDMVRQGQMSRSDLAQLEAQVASGAYDVVNTRTQIYQVKLQLKQLLELAPQDDIAIAAMAVSDEMALALIPNKLDVYANALAQRPEVKRAQLAIEQSAIATKIASTQARPTVNLTGSLGDSHSTALSTAFGTQLKNNLALSLGLGVSIPILDNRQAKSAVERAKVGELTAALDLEDSKKKLYQSVENYWLAATNNQQKFIAARKNTESATTTYALVSDQYAAGVKNIVDLLQSREKLLNAKQSLLQDKYTTLLNAMLLQFYNLGTTKL